MFKKLKIKHDKLKLSDLNNTLLLLTIIFLIISSYFLNNIWLAIIIYLFIYDLYIHSKNKITSFLTYISGILLIAFLFLNLTNLNILQFNFNKYLFLTLKILLVLDYIIIILKEIKNKKIKYLKGKKKKYTFKELRKRKIDSLKKRNKVLIDNYLEEENINLKSNYAKLINDNLDYLTKNDLENYIQIEYLRFYKNKNNNKSFDRFGVFFLSIHVIILLLCLLVR